MREIFLLLQGTCSSNCGCRLCVLGRSVTSVWDEAGGIRWMSAVMSARGIAIAEGGGEGGAAADVARVAKMFFENEVRLRNC